MDHKQMRCIHIILTTGMKASKIQVLTGSATQFAYRLLDHLLLVPPAAENYATTGNGREHADGDAAAQRSRSSATNN
eukprot:4035277-Pleurochrysis_carterae.AAC.2